MHWVLSTWVCAGLVRISLEHFLFLKDALGAGFKLGGANAGLRCVPIRAEGRDGSCLPLQLLMCTSRQNMQGIPLISPSEAGAGS